MKYFVIGLLPATGETVCRIEKSDKPLEYLNHHGSTILLRVPFDKFLHVAGHLRQHLKYELNWIDCDECQGTGRFYFTRDNKLEQSQICEKCKGLGLV